MKDELLPLSEMSFTGPVTVGGPNVTLHGDASSIYDQILALNPEFDASAFGGAGSVERGLEARQSTVSFAFFNIGVRYTGLAAASRSLGLPLFQGMVC